MIILLSSLVHQIQTFRVKRVQRFKGPPQKLRTVETKSVLKAHTLKVKTENPVNKHGFLMYTAATHF
jgi:hypothetical protein